MVLSIAARNFSSKNSTNMLPGGSGLIIYAITEGFFWMLCSRQTRLVALRSSLRLSGSSVRPLVRESDKFNRRKLMRAADEKLIINELGPYGLWATMTGTAMGFRPNCCMHG